MPHRYHGLDLLRFGCAVAVVLYHYYFYIGHIEFFTSPEWDAKFSGIGEITRYFNLGVELFFVISGFVIILSAHQKTAREFLVARLLRIYPAFWICCTLAFTARAYSSFAPSVTWYEYWANMALLQKFFNVQYVDGVYWTLFYEIVFYGWITLLILCRQMKRYEYFLLAGLLLSVAFYLFGLPASLFLQKLHFITLPKYFCYFALGSLVYLFLSEGMTKLRVGMFLLALVLAGKGILTTVQYNNQAWFEIMGRDAYAPAIACMIFYLSFGLFVLLVIRRRPYRHVRLITLLGNSSYPLYLLHGVVGYLLISKLLPYMDKAVAVTGTMLCMIVCSILIHRYGEVPLRKVLKMEMRIPGSRNRKKIAGKE